MKYLKFIKREAINWLLMLLPLIYILLVYDRLPRFAPFQADSEQRIYHLLLFTMGFCILTYIVLLVKPSIVPKTAFHDNLKSLHRIRTLMVVFLSFLSLTYISQGIGIPLIGRKLVLLLRWSLWQYSEISILLLDIIILLELRIHGLKAMNIYGRKHIVLLARYFSLVD